MNPRFDSVKDAVAELRRLQATQPFDMAAIRAVQDWMHQHPEDTVSSIRTSGLGKYDGLLAEVIGRIGSPAATHCIPALVSVMEDINWPAYGPARDALFGFDADALLTGLEMALERGEFEGFDGFCYEARQRHPAWLPRLRPLAERALQSRKDSDIDLPHTLDLVESI